MVTEEMKAEFLTVKNSYDSYSQAVKLARSSGVSVEDLAPLLRHKASYKDRLSGIISSILKKMSSQNIVSLGEGWYGIRYLSDKKDVALQIEPLIEKDLYMIERDSKTSKDLTKLDIDSLVIAVVDWNRLEEYKTIISATAKTLVQQYLGVVVEESNSDDADKPLSISFHAGNRWVQRVWKIHPTNERLAEEYRRTNQKQVEEDILANFATAEHIWTGEDGVMYYFDSNNIVYVKGINPHTIITVYEEDFGFSKQINRNIVIGQLAVLAKANEDAKRHEAEYMNGINSLDKVIYDVNDQIKLKEAEIAQLSSTKSIYLAQRESYIKGMTTERIALSIEFNKLFKKFEV